MSSAATEIAGEVPADPVSPELRRYIDQLQSIKDHYCSREFPKLRADLPIEPIITLTQLNDLDGLKQQINEFGCELDAIKEFIETSPLRKMAAMADSLDIDEYSSLQNKLQNVVNEWPKKQREMQRWRDICAEFDRMKQYLMDKGVSEKQRTQLEYERFNMQCRQVMNKGIRDLDSKMDKIEIKRQKLYNEQRLGKKSDIGDNETEMQVLLLLLEEKFIKETKILNNYLEIFKKDIHEKNKSEEYSLKQQKSAMDKRVSNKLQMLKESKVVLSNPMKSIMMMSSLIRSCVKKGTGINIDYKKWRKNHKSDEWWKISIIMRSMFRRIFGIIALNQCGHFLDKEMSRICHDYCYWLIYPTQTYSNNVSTILNLPRYYPTQFVITEDDGRYLYIDSELNYLECWDLLTHEKILHFAEDTCGTSSLCYYPGWLVSGSRGDTVRLWDSYTHQWIRSFIGHKSSISCLCFSNNGQHLFSGSNDRTLRQWSVETGECLRILGEDGREFKSGLKRVMIVDQKSTTKSLMMMAVLMNDCVKYARWNINNNDDDDHSDEKSSLLIKMKKIKSKISGFLINDFDINCDGSLIAISDQNDVNVYRWPPKKVKKSLSLKTENSSVCCFHPMIPHLLVIDHFYDHSLRVFDLRINRMVHSFKVDVSPSVGFIKVKFTSDGQQIIACLTDGTLMILDTSALV